MNTKGTVKRKIHVQSRPHVELTFIFDGPQTEALQRETQSGHQSSETVTYSNGDHDGSLVFLRERKLLHTHCGHGRFGPSHLASWDFHGGPKMPRV
jgi:hypothetical protein